MYSINESKLVEEEVLEVKIVPISGRYIIQVASEPIRGTLIVLNDIDEEELKEFSVALFSMIQHFEIQLGHEGETLRMKLVPL